MVYKLLEVDKGVAGVKVFTAEREDEQSSCAARAAVASALMRSSDPRTPHLADFVSCGRCGVDTSLTTCTANLVTHTDKRSLKKIRTARAHLIALRIIGIQEDIPWVPFCHLCKS